MINKKTVVILSDVFGMTPALKQLVGEIAANQQSVIIDPYQGRDMAFASEALAYQCFTEQVGLASYLVMVKRELTELAKLTTIDCVLGFSVGGSVVWQLAAQAPALLAPEVNIACYASQIRNMTELRPQVPIELVMPKFETHFDVCGLAETVSQIENVSVSHTEYLHGFINKCSTNFSEQGYRQFCQQLANKIKHL